MWRKVCRLLKKVETPKRVENIEVLKDNLGHNVPEKKNESLEVKWVVDMDKLAIAVARQETKWCTLWYWASYNNCFWIKNWNTAPCEKVWRNKMCIYETPEESFEAFKKIWSETWYNWMPTLKKSVVWTWNDRPQIWLDNVLHFYNEA